MKIIIVGAGRVGESIAENLLSESNEITIIDHDAQRLRDLQDRFDLRGVNGSASEIEVLTEAGAADTELLIACTSQEETNLVVCKLAQMAFNIPVRIARVQAVHLEQMDILLSPEGFAISSIICPEESLTHYIMKLVEFPQALQVRDFAGGLASLASVRARAGSPLVRHTISEIREMLPQANMRVVAIYRRLWDGPDQLIMTDGNTRIEPDDEVFVLAAKKHLPVILDGLHQLPTKIKEEQISSEDEEETPHKITSQRIIIAGGGRVGERLAQYLAASPANHNLKIIEQNHDRCIALASRLKDSVLVLQGNATDEDLLEEENVTHVDLFMAVTRNDEDNIMAALLAKRLGAKRVLALINRRTYADLMHSTQIDIALSPAQAMLGELLTHVRRGEVRAVHSLRRGVAEALEIVALGTSKTSKVIGRPIKELKLPAGAQVGLIIRGLTEPSQEEITHEVKERSLLTDGLSFPPPPPDAQVIVATGDTVIQSGDHVILFLPSKRLIHDVEKLFKISATFF